MEGAPFQVGGGLEEFRKGWAARGRGRVLNDPEAFLDRFEEGDGAGEVAPRDEDLEAGDGGVGEIGFQAEGCVDGFFGAGDVGGGEAAAGAEGFEVGVGSAEPLFDAIEAGFERGGVVFEEVEVDRQEVGEGFVGVERAGFLEGGEVGRGVGIEHEDLECGHEDRALGAKSGREFWPDGRDGGRVFLTEGCIEVEDELRVGGLIDAEESVGERPVGGGGEGEEDGAQAVWNVEAGGVVVDIGEACGAGGVVEAREDVEVGGGAAGEEASDEGGGSGGCFVESEEDGGSSLEGGEQFGGIGAEASDESVAELGPLGILFEVQTGKRGVSHDLEVELARDGVEFAGAETAGQAAPEFLEHFAACGCEGTRVGAGKWTVGGGGEGGSGGCGVGAAASCEDGGGESEQGGEEVDGAHGDEEHRGPRKSLATYLARGNMILRAVGDGSRAMDAAYETTCADESAGLGAGADGLGSPD